MNSSEGSDTRAIYGCQTPQYQNSQPNAICAARGACAELSEL